MDDVTFYNTNTITNIIYSIPGLIYTDRRKKENCRSELKLHTLEFSIQISNPLRMFYVLQPVFETKHKITQYYNNRLIKMYLMHSENIENDYKLKTPRCLGRGYRVDSTCCSCISIQIYLHGMHTYSRMCPSIAMISFLEH